MNNAIRLKERLKQPGTIVAPGVYDCVGAKIVEKLGFQAVYMTGNGSVASKIGYPDIGLASANQMVEWAGNIANCVAIPLICDADNGYGDLNNVRYTVRQFETAGVAAIHIEDQGFPKKCGAMEGIKVIPAEEAAEKIRIAVKSRENMIIIGRSDSLAVYHDTKEMIRRLRLFADAGADIVYPEMIESIDQLKEITRQVDAPVMFDILECNDFNPTVKELENTGVKIVINCLTLMMSNCALMTRLLKEYKETGDTGSFRANMMELHEYERLMGLEAEQSIRTLLK